MFGGKLREGGYNNELNKLKRMIFVFEHGRHGMNEKEN
jgi:hypothetical protein